MQNQMPDPFQGIEQAWILAAGLGTRLKAVTEHKPFLSFGEKTLLERLIEQFLDQGISKVVCALHKSEEIESKKLSILQDPRVSVIFCETPSSFHTFETVARHVLSQQTKISNKIFVSMVDTVLKKEDLQSFLKFCSREHQGKTQLLVTPFVEDEKPLVVKVDGNRNEKQSEIVQIGGTFEAGDVVTSGMYCFSPLVFDLFKGQSKDQENQDLKNMNKMRNFLNFLLQNGFKMSSFRVEKTIDIDHPEDIKTAENFLKY